MQLVVVLLVLLLLGMRLQWPIVLRGRRPWLCVLCCRRMQMLEFRSDGGKCEIGPD